MNISDVARLPVLPASPVTAPTVERGNGKRVVGVAIACALGVLLQAYVGYKGRETGNPPALLFWFSLALMFGAGALAVLTSRFSRSETLVVVVLVWVGMQLTRLVLYPNLFAYHDELIHVRVLGDILATHHLFTPNSTLPVTPRYPGLEILSAAIADLTGLSAHVAGSIALLLARLIMGLALFLIVERLARSYRIAAAASLIYVANPQYLFFNSQYSYQTLALPLCFAFVYLIVKLEAAPRVVAWPCLLAGGITIAICHHLTAVGLVVLLGCWSIACAFQGHRPRYLNSAFVIALLSVIGWGFLARHTIVPYISGITENNVESVQQLISGRAHHVFFKDNAGDTTPAWERLASLASVLVLVLLLPIALWSARVFLKTRQAAALVLCVIAAAYPVIPLGHLTNATSEVADRSSGFIFVGVAFLLAWWAFGIRHNGHRRNETRKSRRAFAVLCVFASSLVLFVGGTIVGAGPSWLRAPGKYLVSSDNRSVDVLALAASNWLRSYITPENRLYSDRTNELLASAIGDQHSLTALADGIDNGSLSRLLLAPPSPSDVGFAREAKLQLLLVDRRLATELPHVEVYTDTGEYGSDNRTKPPTKSTVTKFDHMAGADRIYDNGALSLYDVRGIR
jgi:hypothetical protein